MHICIHKNNFVSLYYELYKAIIEYIYYCYG